MMNIGAQQMSSIIRMIEITPLMSISTKKFTITTEREYWKHSTLISNIAVALLIVHIDIPRQSQMYLSTTALIAFY